jgi:putative transcriptional regulator
MGLVVNQALADLRFSDILKELKIGAEADLIRVPETVRQRDVLRGGPVEKGRGFVLHSPDYFKTGNSYAVSDEVCLTATLDVLHAIAFESGPHEALFALGYCGWSPGQLENELLHNGWLTVPFSRELLFGIPIGERYDLALKSLGITRASLSSVAGNA